MFKRLILSVMLMLPFSAQSFEKVELNCTDSYVAFSPRGEGQSLIVDRIGLAKKEILVQAYGFTNQRITEALIKAKQRGVDVQVLVDKSNETAKFSKVKDLLKAGITVLVDSKPAIAHNKVMIFDESAVITGSFNFTSAAQNKNAENVLLLENQELAKVYKDYWINREQESRKWKNSVKSK